MEVDVVADIGVVLENGEKEIDNDSTTKKRHNLTYSAAVNIMRLAGLFASDSSQFLPSKHRLKTIINFFSSAVTEHDMCPNCQRDKTNQYNFEDIYDGKMYKASVHSDEISFNFFEDGVQVATT
ncbi:putative cytosol aminopeptidase, partial [Frankliniella fusca]